MDNYSAPKPMKRLGDLFEKYKKNIKAPQASIEKEAVEVIETVSGINLTIKQVSYTVSTRTLVLRVPSILKSELMLRKEEILKELKIRLGEDSVPKTIL